MFQKMALKPMQETHMQLIGLLATCFVDTTITKQLIFKASWYEILLPDSFSLHTTRVSALLDTPHTPLDSPFDIEDALLIWINSAMKNARDCGLFDFGDELLDDLQLDLRDGRGLAALLSVYAPHGTVDLANLQKKKTEERMSTAVFFWGAGHKVFLDRGEFSGEKCRTSGKVSGPGRGPGHHCSAKN